MKSFGLWYQRTNCSVASRQASNSDDPPNIAKEDQNQGPVQPEFSLHVNFWSLEDIKIGPEVNNPKIPYLDIGIKIKQYEHLDKLFFYCPFMLQDKEIDDLSGKLSEKDNASMIFNKECKVSINEAYTLVELENKNGKKEKLLLFQMKESVKDIFKIEPLEDNTCELIFDFEKFNKYISKFLNDDEREYEAYIRFRILSNKFKGGLYFDSEPLNKSFESAFSGTRIIDFRINEKRTIPQTIKASILTQDQTWASLKAVHFLVMEPASYDITSVTEDKLTCRELEEGLWDDYLGMPIDCKKSRVLAYHWKNSNGTEQESFSCLVKINYSKTNMKTILSYIFIVIGLGIISSLLVTAIFEAISSSMVYIVKSILFSIIGATLFIVLGCVIGKRHDH